MPSSLTFSTSCDAHLEVGCMPTHFNFDNYSLLMCPAASLVLEFLIATDIFLGLCIFSLNLTYQVGRQLVEFLITRQSCYKAHLVLLGSPGHNLMATEHGIASDDNHCILPFLPQFFNQTENQACHVGALVYTARSENGEDELAAISFKDEQGHKAILMIIIIEQ